MSRDHRETEPARALNDDLLNLIVRGVFAFTLAVSGAAVDAADRRRSEFLRRQEPQLN